MRLMNIVIIIFLALGLLAVPCVVFAEQNVVASSGSTWDVIPSGIFINGFVPLLKGGADIEDIQEFLAMPLVDQIFVIVAALLIIIFVVWYSMKGKYMKLSYRIPIIIAFLLLIFVPLYLIGNMLYFVTAAVVTFIVLIAMWYQEHGRHMSMTRLIGTVIVACLVLGLVIGVPGYFYFSASDEINDVTVTSKNSTLEIVDYKVYRSAFTDQTEVKFEGYVKNNGKTTARFVEVNATGYDAAGNLVANNTVSIDTNDLLPGSTSPFGQISSYYSTLGYLDDPQKRIVKVKLEAYTDF